VKNRNPANEGNKPGCQFIGLATTINYRFAEESDNDQLEVLEASIWNQANSPAGGYDGAVFGKRIPFSDTIVACAGDEIVGYVAIGNRTPFASNGHVGVLRSIAVGSKWRGRGIGKSLLERAKTEAKKRGQRVIRLSVMSSNESALALYRADDWQEAARFEAEFVVDGKPINDIILTKEL
jgi:ribosomal protein S18 acetylase RimI-like enzyme